MRNQQQMDSALAGTDLVILLAAQHRDNVTPTSLYFDTNVGGTLSTLLAMERNGVKRILFFSSVAVYGINKDNPDETSPKDPFNHYGKSKWQAEQLLQEWHTMHADWNINVVRPTVTFGERNRGNVYNLLHQIQCRHFLMVGNGRNRKSMAYVGNIVAFVKFLIDNYTSGYNVFNYIDKPDYDMNQLVQHVETVLQKRLPAIRIPYAIGMAGGYCLDALAWLLRRMDNAQGWAEFSGIYGLCFGGLCEAVKLVARTPAFALSWWLSGLSYDVMHGVGNFVIMLLLYRPLRRALQMAKRQIHLD